MTITAWAGSIAVMGYKYDQRLAAVEGTQKALVEFVAQATSARRALASRERLRVELCRSGKLVDPLLCVSLPSEAELQAMER